MLIRRLYSYFLLLAAAGPVTAQDCSLISSPVDRLACFDAMTGRPSNSTREFGNWQVDEYADGPLATVASVENVQCGRENDKARLSIDCTAQFPLLFVSVPCRPVSPSGEVYALFEMQTHSFELTFFSSPDGRNLGTWMNDIQAIRALDDGPLSISFAGVDQTLTPASFDLFGFDELREYLLDQECIWNPRTG
jgi:hypothetical protein